LSSVTLDKEGFGHSAKHSTKSPLPSNQYLALEPLCRVPILGSRQRLSAVSGPSALGWPLTAFCRAPPLSSVDTRQTCLCRVGSCAECPALGKEARCREPNFIECSSRQSLLCRVPDKRHSAKSRIPVVTGISGRVFGTDATMVNEAAKGKSNACQQWVMS
jgi:hypothetical protein